MVANATVCAGCCYIAIFRFPAPFLLSSSRNIRRLRYDGTMSARGFVRLVHLQRSANAMKRTGQCVLRDHGDEDFQADMPSYAGRHSFRMVWPEPWTRRSLGCENHRRILFHG